LLVLDLLESYVGERDAEVRLERRNSDRHWTCVLTAANRGDGVRALGESAREAISNALREVGVTLPG
jgi:hypothetical protein